MDLVLYFAETSNFVLYAISCPWCRYNGSDKELSGKTSVAFNYEHERIIYLLATILRANFQCRGRF